MRSDNPKQALISIHALREEGDKTPPEAFFAP